MGEEGLILAATEELLPAAESLAERALPSAGRFLEEILPAATRAPGLRTGVGGKLIELPMQKLQAAWGERNLPAVALVNENSWLATTYGKCANSVVRLTDGIDRWCGTGFFFQPELPSQANQAWLATSAHVASWGKFSARLTNGLIREAEVSAFDKEADVAVLKVATQPGDVFNPLKLGKPIRLTSFRSAAIGFPATSLEEAPVISPGMLQSVSYGSDAEVSFSMKTWHGNSGSPIVDRDGAVLGIVQTGSGGVRYSASTSGPSVEHVRALMKTIEKEGAGEGPLWVSTKVQTAEIPTLRMLHREDLLQLSKDQSQLKMLERQFKVRVTSAHRWT